MNIILHINIGCSFSIRCIFAMIIHKCIYCIYFDIIFTTSTKTEMNICV